MKRLTDKRCNGIKRGYWSPAKKEDLVQRLGLYEDTELEPEQVIPYSHDELVERMVSWLQTRDPENLEGFCEDFAGWEYMDEDEQEAFMAGFLCGNKNAREDLAEMLEGGGLDIF